MLVSSLAALGPGEAGRPVTDAQEPRPVTDYGRSKLANALFSLNIFPASGMCGQSSGMCS